jgi:hypothetical protein
VPVAFVALAAPGTVWSQAGSQQKVTDRTLAPSVRAACDLVYRLSAPTGGVSIKRSTGRFQDETLPRPVDGCQLSMKGSFRRAKDGAVPDRLHTKLAENGWEELLDYSADGPDGTSFAFRRDDVACVVRGQWDGGDDSDPRASPATGIAITVICARGIPATRF